jgi:hypothetical protein
MSPRRRGLDRQLQSLYLERIETMPLATIVVTLIVVGVVLWAINTYIPMANSIKTILNVVVVITVAIWVLRAMGMWGQISSYRFMP